MQGMAARSALRRPQARRGRCRSGGDAIADALVAAILGLVSRGQRSQRINRRRARMARLRESRLGQLLKGVFTGSSAPIRREALIAGRVGGL